MKSLEPRSIINAFRAPSVEVGGSGRLDWPDDHDLRLSGQLALFRRLASGELDAADFAFDYFFSGDNNITRTIQEMSEKLFVTLSEDLRFRLEEVAEAATTLGEVGIPAADRVVTLDHNSRAYLEAMQKITDLEEALRTSNAIEPDEKARLKAEITSGKILLAAPRTRLAAIKGVLLSPLAWIVAAFASGALGEIAALALHAVASLVGIPL